MEATITIHCKQEGYRRAGRSWPKGATTVPLKDFSEEQLKALREDPEIVIGGDGLSADELDEKTADAFELLDQVTGERDAALKAVDDYKAQLDQARTDLSNALGERSKLQVDLDKANSEIAALKSQLEKANSDLEAAKAKKGGK